MDIANDPGDFVVTSNSVSADDLRTSLADADARASAAVAPPENAPAPVEAAPAPAEEPADEPATDGAAEGAADPAAHEDPEVAAAAAKLPTGDSKAGKTLSDRARVIQAEIHHLTAQKTQTRVEADATRAELAQLRAERERIVAELQARQTQAAPAAPDKPKSENFDSFEAFTDALGQYYRDEAKREAATTTEQLIAQTVERLRAEEQQRQQQRDFDQVVQQHNANLAAARAAHPDFDEVVAGSALPTNPMMEAHIPRSPVSGELLHYLATHPDECAAIAGMSAGPTLVALGRIEERIGAVKSGPAPVRTPTAVSKARAPIKPVGASGGTADEVPSETVPLDEHVAYWNRKDRERRGAGRR